MIIVSGNSFRTIDDDIYANGKKVVEAYVNDQLVYPEQRLQYTVKYKMRVDFEYHHETYSWYEDDVDSTGYYEDTIRINSYWPMFVKTAPIMQPENRVEADIAYDYYFNFSGYHGTEYFITPYPALYAYERGNLYYDVTKVYGKHSKNFWVNHGRKTSFYTNRMEIIMHRKVVNRFVDSDTDFISRNFIKVYSPSNGSYSLTYASIEIEGFRNQYMGFDYRVGLGENNETYAFVSPCEPAFAARYVERWLFDQFLGDGLGGNPYIPLFSGHMYREVNHVYRPNTSHPSSVHSHLDLTSSFHLIENNNPVFASVGDYVRYFVGG